VTLDDQAASVDGEDAAASPMTKVELVHHKERVVLSEENFEGNVLSAVRADGFKYIRANMGNPRGLAPEELYEVQPDPGELNNIVGKNGRVQAAMSVLLRDQLKAAISVGVSAQTADISADDCERMRALGYIDGDCSELSAGPVSTGASPEVD
jgi:hypothetical protein